MTTLCYILHLRNKEVPADPDAKHVLYVAMLADKYDCMEAMMHTAQCWVSKHLDLTTTQPKDRYTLLIAACYLQDPNLFQKTAHDLIMKSTTKIYIPRDLVKYDLLDTIDKVHSKYYQLAWQMRA